MLTVHLLTRNNQNTLDDCLESLQPLNATILIGDFNSTDKTLDICRNHEVKIINLPWEKNYSKSRNDIIKITTTDWQLWIEPWERFVSGHEQMLWAITQKEDAYNVYNIQNEMIQKQTRLWRTNKRHFINPVCENLEPADKLINCVLTGIPPSKNETIDLLIEWQQKQPHTADIEYYLACTYASNRDYDKFIKSAERYLFRSPEVSMANILTHYYYGMVQLFVKGNAEECIKHVIQCLVQEPTMAEFWCLLGDAFYKMKQYHRATAFYDNAIIFGSRRLQDDLYPIEVAKYKIYPEKMLNKCREIIKKMHVVS